MQAIDSERLSLAEFSLRAGYLDPKKRLRHKSRRDIVDALRTVYWYNGVQQAAQIFSARGLERRFEPEAFWVSEHGENLRRNKWGKYRAGRHVPSLPIVARVEAELPGLQRDLNHPLWHMLTVDSMSAHPKEIDFFLLAPEIQQVVRRRGLSPAARRQEKLAADGHVASSLERRASLDALAAIVFLLRNAHVNKNPQAAHEWGRRVYRMLLLIGHELVSRKIALPLFELVEKRVMPFAVLDGCTHHFPATHFLNAVFLLNRFLRRIAGRPYNLMSERQKFIHRLEILDGKYGYDQQFAFAPVLKASSKPLPPGEPDKRGIIESQNLFTWAWNMMKTGGHPSLPPDAVWNGTDLWGRAPSNDNA